MKVTRIEEVRYFYIVLQESKLFQKQEGQSNKMPDQLPCIKSNCERHKKRKSSPFTKV